MPKCGKTYDERTGQVRDWWESYELLKKFFEANGHSNVQRFHEDDHLGKWVAYQRTERKMGMLKREQVQALNKLEFQWEPFVDKWEKRWQELRKFKFKYGHCRVKRSYDAGTKNRLSLWVNEQRMKKRKRQLAQERIDLLDSIDFEWNTYNTRRREKYFASRNSGNSDNSGGIAGTAPRRDAVNAQQSDDNDDDGGGGGNGGPEFDSQNFRQENNHRRYDNNEAYTFDMPHRQEAVEQGSPRRVINARGEFEPRGFISAQNPQQSYQQAQIPQQVNQQAQIPQQVNQQAQNLQQINHQTQTPQQINQHAQIPQQNYHQAQLFQQVYQGPQQNYYQTHSQQQVYNQGQNLQQNYQPAQIPQQINQQAPFPQQINQQAQIPQQINQQAQIPQQINPQQAQIPQQINQQAQIPQQVCNQAQNLQQNYQQAQIPQQNYQQAQSSQQNFQQAQIPQQINQQAHDPQPFFNHAQNLQQHYQQVQIPQQNHQQAQIPQQTFQPAQSPQHDSYRRDPALENRQGGCAHTRANSFNSPHQQQERSGSPRRNHDRHGYWRENAIVPNPPEERGQETGNTQRSQEQGNRPRNQGQTDRKRTQENNERHNTRNRPQQQQQQAHTRSESPRRVKNAKGEYEPGDVGARHNHEGNNFATPRQKQVNRQGNHSNNMMSRDNSTTQNQQTEKRRDSYDVDEDKDFEIEEESDYIDEESSDEEGYYSCESDEEKKTSFCKVEGGSSSEEEESTQGVGDSDSESDVVIHGQSSRGNLTTTKFRKNRKELRKIASRSHLEPPVRKRKKRQKPSSSESDSDDDDDSNMNYDDDDKGSACNKKPRDCKQLSCKRSPASNARTPVKAGTAASMTSMKVKSKFLEKPNSGTEARNQRARSATNRPHELDPFHHGGVPPDAAPPSKEASKENRTWNRARNETDETYQVLARIIKALEGAAPDHCLKRCIGFVQFMTYQEGLRQQKISNDDTVVPEICTSKASETASMWLQRQCKEFAGVLYQSKSRCDGRASLTLNRCSFFLYHQLRSHQGATGKKVGADDDQDLFILLLPWIEELYETKSPAHFEQCKNFLQHLVKCEKAKLEQQGNRNCDHYICLDTSSPETGFHLLFLAMELGDVMLLQQRSIKRDDDAAKSEQRKKFRNLVRRCENKFKVEMKQAAARAKAARARLADSVPSQEPARDDGIVGI